MEKLTDQEISNLLDVNDIMLADMYVAILTEEMLGRQGRKPPISENDAESLVTIAIEFSAALDELTENRTL